MTAPFLEFPTSAIPASVVMTLSSVVGRSESPFTFEGQSFKWPGERWMANIQMPVIADEDIADEWIAFALKLQGTFGTFLLGDPSRPTMRGIGGGSPVVDGSANTGNTMDIIGAPTLTANWMKRGDYFQMNTGASSRLHKLTSHASTDSAGRATLEFTPALRYTPADGETITITNPRGVFRLAENDVSWSREPGHLTRMSFNAVEVL